MSSKKIKYKPSPELCRVNPFVNNNTALPYSNYVFNPESAYVTCKECRGIFRVKTGSSLEQRIKEVQNQQVFYISRFQCPKCEPSCQCEGWLISDSYISYEKNSDLQEAGRRILANHKLRMREGEFVRRDLEYRDLRNCIK